MHEFTTTVRESRRQGRYRYGIINIETSDLLHLVGQKVHVLVLQEEEYRQLMDTLQGEDNKEICMELESFEQKLEEVLDNYVNTAKSTREQTLRRREIQELKRRLEDLSRRLRC